MIADAFIATAAALAVIATTPAVPARPAPPAPVVEQAAAAADTEGLIPVEIWLTKYTCDYHPDNVMTNSPGMCLVTASGGDPHTVGIACPAEWIGTDIYLPDWGWRTCDDTGKYPDWKGKKHLDLRVLNWAEAWPGYSGYYTVYVYGGLP